MEDFLELAERRRSIRRFHPNPLDFDDVLYLLRSAMAAPSAGDRQMWEFVIVTDKQKISELAGLCPEQGWLASAPLVLAVVANEDSARTYFHDQTHDWCLQSCSAAIQNMLLAAEDRGLGACWVTSFDQGQLRDALSVPDTRYLVALVAVGKPDQDPGEKEVRAMDQTVFVNEYGQSVTDFDTAIRTYSVALAKRRKQAGEALGEASEESAGRLRAFFDKLRNKK